VVCKRANSPEAKLCGVCFTKKDYKKKVKDPKAHPEKEKEKEKEKERKQRNSYAPDIRKKNYGANEDNFAGDIFGHAAEARRAAGGQARPQTVAGNTPNSRKKQQQQRRQQQQQQQQQEKETEKGKGKVEDNVFEAQAKSEKPWWVLEEEEAAKNKPQVNPPDSSFDNSKRAPSIRVRSDTVGNMKNKKSPGKKKTNQAMKTPPIKSPSTNASFNEEVDTDEEFEGAEETWDYTESDADFSEINTTYGAGTPRPNLSGTGVGTSRVIPEEINVDDGADEYEGEDFDPETPHQKGGKTRMGESCYVLNVKETKLHNVRFEPFLSSPVVGHLLMDREIVAIAECGEWCKVRYHRSYEGGKLDEEKKVEGREEVGWCLRAKNGIQYLVPLAEVGVEAEESEIHTESESGMNSGDKDKSVPGFFGDDGEETWYELRDDDGELYYFNSGSGVSQWEPPRWFSEVDPVSGAVYYVDTNTGEPQWDKPNDFVPVVREEVYSTPEADFVKNMLSPKRSHFNLNAFKNANNNTNKADVTTDV